MLNIYFIFNKNFRPYTTNVFKRSKNEQDIRFVGQNGDKMIVNTYLNENNSIQGYNYNCTTLWLEKIL